MAAAERHAVSASREMTAREFAMWTIAIAGVALALRLVFPTADPPWETTVGIVWHDEGAWVHNARNRALFGAWSQDNWNPMYIAPVFTALEYASFAAFGVGVWQARLVSELTGFASVLLLAFGVRRISGREAGAIAGALAATNYVYVMWNRAALMEASMVAFIVAAWYCYVRAHADARWSWPAAACALLAYFTKAAAIFFVGALALAALFDAVAPSVAGDVRARRAGRATIAALTICGLAALVLFVLPNWTEYRFYNWQMSVTRKPSYDLASLKNRVTWFPILHDIFTRMWFTVIVGVLAIFGTAVRWTRTSPGERLLSLWIVLGVFELLLHDVGNERRFLIFIPALIALTAMTLGRERRLLPQEAANVSRGQLLMAMPFLGYALYVLVGSLLRLAYLYVPGPGVRLSAAVAAVLALVIAFTWPKPARLLAAPQWTARAGIWIAMVVAAGQLAQYAQWAVGRSYKNYETSRELGRVLPAETLVHGKLANGLSLENRIRPVFVGQDFGNYADRKQRDDVRYILTYIAPETGYEGSVILDVLDAYPDRTIIRTFDVAETPTGHDRAALIDKFGGKVGNTVPTQVAPRAHD
jgi:4-amino-4-deoxy-L-arabinose transferase-like glycosyltransferase